VELDLAYENRSLPASAAWDVKLSETEGAGSLTFAQWERFHRQGETIAADD
jgi:hypothetical protein